MPAPAFWFTRNLIVMPRLLLAKKNGKYMSKTGKYLLRLGFGDTHRCIKSYPQTNAMVKVVELLKACRLMLISAQRGISDCD
jgi:hypothetical protein